MLLPTAALLVLTSLPSMRLERFNVAEPSEVVATITAGCAGCDWRMDGAEAALLEVDVDGVYSQHLALTRGADPAPYRVMLGLLPAGAHQLELGRDDERSAPHAGAVTIARVDVRAYPRTAPEFAWLSRAPFLHARPGTVEHFSDFPLLMYAERNAGNEGPAPYALQYTVIFTNEDGGTPADRLMATWGRTTDIEFVLGITPPRGGEPEREIIQVEGHHWVPFAGPHQGTHPVLWVATDNNMVADHGATGLITFAPAPFMVDLTDTSREAVMDRAPWTYAVTSAEAYREGRVADDPGAGSGHIADPRRYATIEACGEVRNATLAFDIGVLRHGKTEWVATDRGLPEFRIARGGCFRGAAPLPAGVHPADIIRLRLRAYPRPPREGEAPVPAGAAHVVLTRVNKVFMLDDGFVPRASGFEWRGTLRVPADGAAVEIPGSPHR